MARKVNRDAVLGRKGTTRGERTAQTARSKSREISDDERVDMLRMSMFQSALPDIPPIEGHHVCWLTTANPRDSIIGRERLGYTLIRASELPEFEFPAQKGGQFDGCIMINEMVAAKIPLRLYQRFMANNHHQEPLREEERISYDNQAKKAQAAQHGAVMIEAPAMVALGKDPGIPNFTAAPTPSLPMSPNQKFDEDWSDYRAE